MEALEALLLDSVSGDAEKMAAAIREFDDLAAKSVSQLYSAFCEVMLHSTNSKAVSIAVVDLTQLIKQSWDALDENLRDRAVDFVIEFFKVLKECDSYFYAQLLRELSLHVMNVNLWIPLFEEMKGNERTASVVIELLASNEAVPPQEFFQKFMDVSIRYTLDALQGTALYYKCRSIRAVANALNIFPDQYERFIEHFHAIRTEMENSRTMQERDYRQFWTACSILFRSGAIPYEEFEKERYAELILAATDREDLSAETRILPLRSFAKILPYMCGEYLVRIGRMSMDLGALYVKQTGELPSEFVFFYGKCFDCFPHKQIYGVAREMIYNLMESGAEENMIACMCVIKVLVERIPQQVYGDIDFINRHVEQALKQPNPLLIQCACKIISVFSKFLARNLIDVEVFLPATICLLSHPINDVRFSATIALERIFTIAPVPLPNIVKMMFAVADKILDDDKLRFLFLFSEAIEAQMIIEEAEAEQILEFVRRLITSDNEDYLAGALKISVKMLKCTEKLSDTLVPIVAKLLDMGLSSDNIHWRSYATWILGEFLTVDQKLTMELFAKHRDAINSLLQIPDGSFSGTKEHIAIEVSHVNASTSDHPLSDILLDTGMAWLESPISTTTCAALKLLKRGVLYRPNEHVMAMMANVAKTCCQTKDMSVAIRCIKTMGYVVRQAKDDIKAALRALAGQVSMSFIRGEMSVQNNLPPLTTDTDFGLVRELAKQSIFWMDPSKSIQREIYAFSMTVFQRRNVLTMELALQFWSDVLKIHGFLPEEVATIKSVAMECMAIDVNPCLMMNTALVVETLVSQEAITKEEIAPKFHVLVKWWNNCCEIKHRMRSTLSGILSLMLTIIGVFKLPLARFNPVLLTTLLNQVPPDDVRRTAQVASMLAVIFSRDDDIPLEVCIAGATAICRLLMLSDALLMRKRRVTPEVRSQLVAIVNTLRNGHTEVENAITDLVKDNPRKKERLDALLQS